MDKTRPDSFHAARLPIGTQVTFTWRGSERTGHVVRHTWRKTGLSRVSPFSPRVVVSFELNGKAHESIQPPLDVRKVRPIEQAPPAL
jgi:hypothetical protein